MTWTGSRPASIAVIAVIAAGLGTAAASGRPGGGGTSAAADPMAALEASIVETVDAVVPSVVSIESQVPLQRMMDDSGMFPFLDPRLFFDPDSLGQPDGDADGDAERLVPQGGTGLVHRADGYIVTNNHVVDGARSIRVTFADGQTYDAEIVGTDPESDVAVIHIDATGLTPARYADVDQIRPGQFAIAVGMPLGLDYSVTVGHVSALGRGGLYPSSGPFPFGSGEPDRSLTIQNFIQTDAAINPGNSGGPLVNLAGEVMGLNTIVQNGVGGGFGFAISADLVSRAADQLIATGRVSRAWLGVTMTDLTFEKGQALDVGRNRGALIEEVGAGSPAAEAGLERGDVIVAVDGHEVVDSKDVVYRVSSHLAGDEIDLSTIRDGKVRSIRVVTGERAAGLASMGGEPAVREGRQEAEPAEAVTRYGMELSALDPDLNARLDRAADAGGVAVLSVEPSGPAHRGGIRAGDVIIDVDGEEVNDPEAVTRRLQNAPREYVPLTVERAGRQRFVVLRTMED